MRTIITIALLAGLVLTAGIVSFWTTSLPAGGSLKSGSIDTRELTLKAKDVPAQEIKDLY